MADRPTLSRLPEDCIRAGRLGWRSVALRTAALDPPGPSRLAGL